ncbi:Yip1 family protein [Haladaptatus salinisoli]|uniref:Yip1 family protein n=1 Tax=Haladaptatus salinisoli TaxID=2884876 RepID=UPI001D0B466E|nr:Yip1 family protein [Haladaptatus salinisoli]
MLLDALFRPDSFFRKRAPRPSLGGAFAVVLVISLVTTVALGAIGWQMSRGMMATGVDNPNRPPDWVCEERTGTDVGFHGCDRPRKVPLGDVMWDLVGKTLPFVFVAPFLVWIASAIVLHALSAFGGGEGSFGNTVSITAWGMLPSLFQTAVGFGLLYLTLRDAELGGSPEAVAEQLRLLVSKIRGGSLLLSAVASLWHWYIWTYGLKHARNLSTEAAGTSVGVVAFLVFLFGAV